MRVLLISTSKGLYDSSNGKYNGGGWIVSLQQHLEKETDIELALAFTSSVQAAKEKRGNTTYYPIYTPEKNLLKKLAYYWSGYKTEVFDKSIVHSLKAAVEDFNPDIIHVFGTESNLGYIIGETNVPCVVHIQGLLSTVTNVYFPFGLNKSSFLSPINIREFWLRNGQVFLYNRMLLSAEREKEIIKSAKYVIGRTDFDKEITELYNPQRIYFHVNEILRPEFYNAEKWAFKGGKLRLVSTLSPTIYKGFDIVLKSAQILLEREVDFEWNIVGINEGHALIKKIEKTVKLYSKNLNINYRGIMKADEIIEMLQDSTIYVHPSYIDNSPNSLCEAQYIGMPTVASNVGGIPTLMVDNVNYMASPLIPPLLAAKIISVYTEIKSGKYINEYVNVAKDRHDVNKILKSLKKTYYTILENNVRF